MTKQIIAISHEIEDESTGATASYHVIEYVSIDYKFKTVTATLNGYVSKKAYDAGRNPLCSHSFSVNALPEDGEVSRAWLYGKAVEQGNDQSIFSGAELIEA
ncbi:hypothetical protein HMPREF3136_03895 [Neisseria sp. HMSC15C08]|nr:hypothetical protein HMPREF3136_03895 [Neisseria sp. HMSC15C08]